jgi:hypothetical protein
MIAEAKITDWLLDLHDQYGGAAPRPRGLVIRFSVVHENTTYQKAKAEIDALLDLHGLATGTELRITPGPEVKGKTNRRIDMAIARDLLM